MTTVITIPNGLKELGMLFDEIYLVGGCVRDMIMGIEPHDYDLATCHLPDEICNILKKNRYKVIEKGKEYGTISTLVDDLGEVEITTFRSEVYERELGRKPIVTFGATLEEDLSRRDFTINSLAFNLKTVNAMAVDLDGNLIDLFGGVKDLKAKIIRFVGDGNERIREDPLRMARACRFSARMGFKIHDMEVIRRNAGEIHRISIERMVACPDGEFNKASENMGKFFRKLVDTGLAKEIFGEIIDEMNDCHHDSRLFHHGESVLDHTYNVLENLDKMGANYATKMAGIMHDFGKPKTREESEGKIRFLKHEKESGEMAEEILKGFKGMSKDMKEILWLIKQHMRLPGISDRNLPRSGIDYKLGNNKINLSWIADAEMLIRSDGKRDFKGLYEKMKIIFETPRPDGRQFMHRPAEKRSGFIRDAWIEAARNRLR